MNDLHKFGTEFGSDDAPEHSAAIVSRHDSIKWFEAIPGEQLCIRVHGTQVNGRDIFHNCIAAIHLCSVNPNTQLFSGDCLKPFDAVMVTDNSCTVFGCIIRSKLRTELVGTIHRFSFPSSLTDPRPGHPRTIDSGL